MWLRDENRLEVVGNMVIDWWALFLESDLSIDSLIYVIFFRGFEFFYSLLEKEGFFINISRGMILRNFLIFKSD